MKFKVVISILLFVYAGIVLSGFAQDNKGHVHDPREGSDLKWNKYTPISRILRKLGDKQIAHDNRGRADFEKLALVGRDLFFEGKTDNKDFGKSKMISIWFKCNDCHNVVIEDPDLTKSDPEARLKYAQENGLPFLQATTMYGTVNRTSWYNGDYYKKYGDMVKPANGSIREAIQLCAQECSQGRKLADWEVEAILAYFWTLELTVGDLNLTEQESAKIIEAEMLLLGQHDKQLVKWLKSKYLAASPATFSDPPSNRLAGYPEITGNPENGRLIYDKACLHCHSYNRVSDFVLDESKLSYRLLHNNMHRYSKWNLYDVVRYGTKPIPGNKPYMPHYTLERMSHQQVEDLRSFLEREARP